jgi:hypothetical protein
MSAVARRGLLGCNAIANTSDGNSMTLRQSFRKRIGAQFRQSQSKFLGVQIQTSNNSERPVDDIPTLRSSSAMQPWMRKEVLNKFGRTVKNRWTPKSSPQNPFQDPMRADTDPLPIEKRIRYWKFARGDRVCYSMAELT